ncbi:MAG: Xaa-Pro peptidase family protein, partial [Acetobacteraceae bacterium]|nr:Xaa-Pro peptidase family protein [Acetobacteraceae bacterium]
PRVQDVWGDIFLQALKDYGVSRGRVGIDPHMSYRTGKLLEHTLKGYELVDLSETLNRLRAIKTPDEIKAIEEACALAEVGLSAGWEALRAGVTEAELCATVSAALLAAGAEGLYARRGTLVVSGERMSYRQESPSLTRVRHGDFVMIDVGPALRGYYCDFCRTSLVGRRPAPWQRELYAATYEALHAALARVRAGVDGTELHEAATAVMERFGIQNATALIGHGVGVAPQESPYCVAGELAAVPDQAVSRVTLEAGMVVAFSSAAYIPGQGGCRFEEVVEVVGGGHRLLSRAPYPGRESFLA